MLLELQDYWKMTRYGVDFTQRTCISLAKLRITEDCPLIKQLDYPRSGG